LVSNSKERHIILQWKRPVGTEFLLVLPSLKGFTGLDIISFTSPAIVLHRALANHYAFSASYTGGSRCKRLFLLLPNRFSLKGAVYARHRDDADADALIVRLARPQVKLYSPERRCGAIKSEQGEVLFFAPSRARSHSAPVIASRLPYVLIQ
jgi:hypothetical protein